MLDVECYKSEYHIRKKTENQWFQSFRKDIIVFLFFCFNDNNVFVNQSLDEQIAH